MSNFEKGDLVEVVNWDSPTWEAHTYEVLFSYTKSAKTYYRIGLVESAPSDYPPGDEGAFTAEHLKYVGSRKAQEIKLLTMSVPELASLVAQATARIIELTKNA